MVLNGAVVVTGAHGFAGRALTAHYEVAGREFRGLVRAHSGATSSRPGFVAVGDLARVDDAQLARLLEGAGAVVHLAGRAHVMRETDPDPLRAYREANVVATARLARAAAAAGVARFIFASTVKVNGEQSPPDRPFRPDDPPSPQDAYARSKREAEAALSDAVAGSATAPIVLRLPLMYGPGVKGNFLALMHAVARGRRLPVGAVTARRSLLYVGNLVHAVDAALDAPVAPAGIHFVADQETPTVAELAQALGRVLDRPARVVTVPLPLLRFAATIAGRRSTFARIAFPLLVDTTSFGRATGFAPPYTLAEGLAATARWWDGSHGPAAGHGVDQLARGP
jgi:nucleoside-diphosphate-sugar epimerase